MDENAIMTLAEEAVASPPCSGPGSSIEVSLDDHRELAGSTSNMDDEMSDFITRQILEQDARLFDG